MSECPGDSFSLRMDFEDFCHYFTDVVVCRLVERALLWPRSQWREVHCYGEWAPAPSTSTPPSAVLKSNCTLSLGKNNIKPGGTKQQGSWKEAPLGETQQKGQKEGKCWKDKTRTKSTEEEESGELTGSWEAQMDKRSRCGGCINHRDTFLHNPQVNLKWESSDRCNDLKHKRDFSSFVSIL